MLEELAREEKVVSSVPTGLFIDGAWRPAETGATFAVEDLRGSAATSFAARTTCSSSARRTSPC